MKRMKIGYRLLIIALLLCGTLLSLASCESAYYDLTEQIQAQNPQFTVPEKNGENTKPPQASEDNIVIDPGPPAHPCFDGHTPVIDPAVAPTCEEDGKTEGTHCSVCQKVLVKQTKISARGHNSSGWSIRYRDDENGTLYAVAKIRYCLTCKVELDRIPFTSREVVSNFDNDGDGKGDVYTFSNYLPDRFLSANAILINGASHFESDLGVAKAERIYNSGIWHYYINLSNKDIPDEMKSLTWEFEVAEAGTYDICFDLDMKDSAEQRGNIMQIDDGEPRMMDYTVTYEFAAAVRDETQSSYMTGISVELTAGKHVIQITDNPLCAKSIHFRNIYLVKAS